MLDLHMYQGEVMKALGINPDEVFARSVTLKVSNTDLMRMTVERYVGHSGDTCTETYTFLLKGDDSTEGRITRNYVLKMGLIIQALGGPDAHVIDMEFRMAVDELNTMKLTMEQSLNRRYSLGIDSGYTEAAACVKLAMQDLYLEKPESLQAPLL